MWYTYHPETFWLSTFGVAFSNVQVDCWSEGSVSSPHKLLSTLIDTDPFEDDFYILAWATRDPETGAHVDKINVSKFVEEAIVEELGRKGKLWTYETNSIDGTYPVFKLPKWIEDRHYLFVEELAG